MNFFLNLSISRFVISLYGLQVSRSLKTCETIKSGLQYIIFFLLGLFASLSSELRDGQLLGQECTQYAKKG